MPRDWNLLSEAAQLAVSQAAFTKAAETIAHQAELLAAEIEAGGLHDRGGPDALRLLAAVVRIGQTDDHGMAASLGCA
jgi:hypothetical protein